MSSIIEDKNIISNDEDDEDSSPTLPFIEHLNDTINQVDSNVDILTTMLLNSGLFNQHDLKFAALHYELTMAMLGELVKDELKAMGYTGDEEDEVELDNDSVDSIRKEAYNIVLENMDYNPRKI